MSAIKYDVVNFYALPGLKPDTLIKLMPIIGKNTLDDILQLVSAETYVSVTSIKSKSRLRDIVKARHIFFLLAKRYTKFSLSDIGFIVGERDHTTVIHGMKAIAGYIESEENLRDIVKKIELKIV